MRFLKILENVEDIVFDKIDSNFNTYVILLNDKEIGEFRYTDDYLDAIEIYPYYQGKGYGSYVLNKLIKDFGIRYLDVDRQNIGALKLYERLGFKKEALIFGNDDGYDNDRYIMKYNKKDNDLTIYYQDNYSDDYTTYTILGERKGNKFYINDLPNIKDELEELNLLPNNIENLLKEE